MKTTRVACPSSFYLALGSSLILIVGLSLSACGNDGKKRLPEQAEVVAPPADTLLTCRICGYRTLPTDTASCPVCYVQLSPAEVIAWGYRSMDEMIREEQAMFFAAEGYREKDFFTEPQRWEAEGAIYRKDPAWKPQITEELVFKMRDTLINAGVIE